MTKVGVQDQGSSPPYTKRMAFDAVRKAVGDARLGVVADVGGGKGELSRQLAEVADVVYLLDYSPPPRDELPANVHPLQADFNAGLPLPDGSVDFAFSLEVIEHVENPRQFLREMQRIVKPGGFLFLTTPNNHSLTSMITFLVRGQHRLFQEQSYPAHITPLLHCDFDRMAKETDLSIKYWCYSNFDNLPKLHWRIPLRGRLFSNIVGVLMQKRCVP